MKMKIIILFLWLSSWGYCGRLMAQVQLTRQQCREMALENSKQMAIAGKDKEKAIYTTKSVRADFFSEDFCFWFRILQSGEVFL